MRIHARWAAGVRYLDYQGAIPVPSWLTGAPLSGLGSAQGAGYSDGVQNHFIVMQQSTTGFGPIGSGEIDFSFFRQRLTLYGSIQAAYLMETLEADSGTFMYLATDSSGAGCIRVPAGSTTRSTSRHGTRRFEAGLRVKILEGFHFIADWNTTGYLDTVMVPVGALDSDERSADRPRDYRDVRLQGFHRDVDQRGAQLPVLTSSATSSQNRG